MVNLGSKGTKGIDVFKTALSGLGNVMKAHPFIATATTIAAVIGLIDLVTTSASEANEKMVSAFDAYTESKDKVASINSELETTQQRINELETHGGLTLVEQSELERLRESTELLRIQQDIAEKNQARAAKESAKAAVEAYNKNFKHGISDSDTKWWSEYYGSSGSHQDEMIRASSYRRSSVPDATDLSRSIALIRASEKVIQEYSSLIGTEADKYDLYQSYVDRSMRTMEDTTDSVWEQVSALNEYRDVLESIPESYRTSEQDRILDQIKQQIDYVYKELDPATWKQMKYDQLFDNKSLRDAKTELVEIAAQSNNVAITADDVRHAMPSIDRYLKGTSLTIDDIVNSINAEAGIIDTEAMIQKIAEQYSSGLTSGLSSFGAKTDYESFVNWAQGLSLDDLKLAYKISLEYDTSGFTLGDWIEQLSAAKQLLNDVNTKSIPDKLSGLLESENFQETRAELESIAKTVDGINAEKVAELAANNKDLAAILEEGGMSARFLAHVLQEELTSGHGLELITEDALELNSALNAASSLFDEVTSAQNRYNDAVSAGEYDDNFRSFSQAYSSLQGEIDAGKQGKQFWAAAEYIFGSKQLEQWGYSVDKVVSAMQGAKELLGDADSGGARFLDKLYALAEDGVVKGSNGSILAEISKLADGSYKFNIDLNQIDDLAQKMGVSREAVMACMEALSLWGDVSFFDIDATIGKLKELGIASDSFENTAVNVEQLRKQLTDLGYSGKEIHDIVQQIGELDDITLMSVTDSAETLSNKLQALGIAAKDANGNITVSADGFVSLMQGLSFSKDQAEQMANSLSTISGLKFTDASGAVVNMAELISEAFNDVEVPEADVKYNVDDSEVQAYQPEDKYAHVVFEPDSNAITVYSPNNKQALVYYNPDTKFIQIYNPEGKHAEVYYEPDTGAIVVYDPETKDAYVYYNPETGQLEIFNPEDKNAHVIFNPETSQIEVYNPQDKSAIAYYNLDASAVLSFNPPNLTRTVTYYAKEGHSGISGKFANGTDSAPGGPSLVGEHGEEIVQSGDVAYIVGSNGPEIVDLRKGDIVYTAPETRKIKRNRRFASGVIPAFANGTNTSTQMAMEAAAREAARKAAAGATSNSTAYQNIYNGVYKATLQKLKANGDAFGDAGGKVKPPSGKPTDSGGNGGGGGGGGGGGSGGGSSKSDDDKLEKVDWIERAIKKIEREIDKLKKTATSAFKSLGTKMTASSAEIAKITEEIKLQEQAAERYRQEAESIELDSDLSQKISDGTKNIIAYNKGAYRLIDEYKKWYDQKDTASVELDEGLKQKVRDGTIDIAEYNEETRKLIEEYKKWYDKSTDCTDAIDDLHESLASLYQENFDNIKSAFDNQLGFIEHDANEIEHNIDMLESKGYMSSAKYYDQIAQNQRNSLAMLNSEKAALEKSLSEAMASGEIEEGSEAWYAMKNAINETHEKIDDVNLSLQETANTIRQIEWDYFDYGSDKIAALVDEAEFLTELISASDLFDKKGQITGEGLAAMGLHGERYNVYMAENDRYAEEIRKLDEEIANDPYNTTLLERREEMIAAQRESILAAQDEKTAIQNLVRQGIELELKSMQELIDKYNDSLDTAKDLYDYQKKVKSQADDIKDIQKQLAAYRNDLSEETRAKVQKLTVSLQDAQDKLEETEYQQYIADQKKLLNDLYSDYERVLNERLDDLDALVADVISQVNASSADICDTLTQVAGSVGYGIGEATQNIWNGSSMTLDGVLTTYGEDFSAKLTGVNASLLNILTAVVAMAEHNDSIAEGSIPRFKKGGLANFTGLAYMDGSNAEPEAVFNARDSANLIALRDLMRRNPDFASYTSGGTPAIKESSDIMRLMSALSSMGANGNVFGDTSILINIDHVEDYNDFVNKLREDSNFERMVRAMTTDLLLKGGSSMAKNKYKW